MRASVTIGMICGLAAVLPALRADEPEPAPPKTHKVSKAPFKSELTIEGLFEPRESRAIVLRPESWSELTVREAIEAGTAVQAGDRLLALDTTKLAEAIRDAEAALKTDKIELEELAAELRVLEQTTPQELAHAKRERDIAANDYKYFTETEKKLDTQQLDFMLKTYTNSLEYAKEELRQLEKMYKADDLMEETEEIIIKQQRDQVEQLGFMLDMARMHRDRTLDADLPRHEQALATAVERTKIASEKAEQTLPLAVHKLQLRMLRSKEELRRGEEKLAKLKHDLEMFTVKAPAAGVVYYGECRGGDWTHAEMANKLRRGGNLSAHEVLMTIVPLRPLVVRATVPEKELAQLQPGLPARVTAAAWPDVKLKAAVERVAALPDPAGKFVVWVKLDPGAVLPEGLAPGMACSVKVTTRNEPAALSLPAKSVHEADDDDRHFVHLLQDGKPVERDVKLGLRHDDQVEILAGLAEGDEVVLDK